jgi:hypothetical protein
MLSIAFLLQIKEMLSHLKADYINKVCLLLLQIILPGHKRNYHILFFGSVNAFK